MAYFPRSQAEALLKTLEDDNGDSDITPYNFSEMSNEELEEELCLSGTIHDELMDGVVDDDDPRAIEWVDLDALEEG